MLPYINHGKVLYSHAGYSWLLVIQPLSLWHITIPWCLPHNLQSRPKNKNNIYITTYITAWPLFHLQWLPCPPLFTQYQYQNLSPFHDQLLLVKTEDSMDYPILVISPSSKTLKSSNPNSPTTQHTTTHWQMSPILPTPDKQPHSPAAVVTTMALSNPHQTANSAATNLVMWLIETTATFPGTDSTWLSSTVGNYREKSTCYVFPSVEGVSWCFPSGSILQLTWCKS